MVKALRLDVFALHEQQAAHSLHVLRQTGARAVDNGDHDRKRAQADQELKMKFADVIDEFVLAGSAAGDHQDDGAFHCTNVRSASTRRASLSRPCEATRM